MAILFLTIFLFALSVLTIPPILAMFIGRVAFMEADASYAALSDGDDSSSQSSAVRLRRLAGVTRVEHLPASQELITLGYEVLDITHTPEPQSAQMVRTCFTLWVSKLSAECPACESDSVSSPLYAITEPVSALPVMRIVTHLESTADFCPQCGFFRPSSPIGLDTTVGLIRLLYPSIAYEHEWFPLRRFRDVPRDAVTEHILISCMAQALRSMTFHSRILTELHDMTRMDKVSWDDDEKRSVFDSMSLATGAHERHELLRDQARRLYDAQPTIRHTMHHLSMRGDGHLSGYRESIGDIPIVDSSVLADDYAHMKYMLFGR